MEQEYTVNWMEVKTTTTGKTYAKLTLEGVQPTVSVWSDFPNFSDIKAGGKVRGILTQKGEYWNLMAPKTQRPQGNRTAGMEKMMDKKAIQIGAAQDNKERGIMTSSTMRMAVDLTVAQISGDPILSKDTAQIKKMIMDWRNWCATRWELTTDNHEPFPSEPVIQVDEGYDSMVEEYPFHERS